jgi:hypothetical protein
MAGLQVMSSLSFLGCPVPHSNASPNHSINRTCPGRPGHAGYLKRWASQKRPSYVRPRMYQLCIRVTAIAFASVVTGATAASDQPYREPPVSAPFSLQASANPTTLHVRIPNSVPYAVSIQFHHGKSPQDSSEAFKLLGGAKRDESGQWSEAGVPARFGVSITRASDSQIVFSREISHPRTAAGYHSRWAELVVPRLEPGNYKVQITGFSESNELQQMRTRAVIAPAHHGK